MVRRMIVITGGAGFIGSCLQAALSDRGLETVVVDRLGEAGKWRNLRGHPPSMVVAPDGADDFLASHPPVDAMFHLGAVSSTMAVDGDAVWASNVALSQRLWTWCARRDVRFVYASSGATYGAGEAGFDDDIGALDRLRPLNLYGWSKHAFDLWVARALSADAPRPPQWAGLKFFNVYGPNEYHKGHMVSVVKVKHDEVARGRRPHLFRSTEPGMADGAQARDFIWVGDVVAVLLWLLDTPGVDGLFNIGTGLARTYLDMAHAVCEAAGTGLEVDFVDMPDALRGQYQSFTQAPVERLARRRLYAAPFTPLEDGRRPATSGTYLAKA